MLFLTLHDWIEDEFVYVAIIRRQLKQAVYTINNILESYAAKDLLVLCCS